MSATPIFAKPPIVELVLGAQFSPLTKLTAGHFGLFWKELGAEWAVPSDGPALPDHFETFDGRNNSRSNAIQIRLEPARLPGRFLIEHQSRNRLIQVQATRFHLNWRKRDDFYPSYQNLIADFEATFSQFAQFAEKTGIGKPELNQWELTYIDSFPPDEYWDTPAEWPRILPGLFGDLFLTEGLGIAMEHRAAEWKYEIEPKRGRLHVVARPARWGNEKQDSLLLEMTARGPIGKGGAESLRAGLDIGHEAAFGTFLRVVGKDIQLRWGTKP